MFSGFHLELIWSEDGRWVVNTGKKVWREYS